jgi:hypothetical protein
MAQHTLDSFDHLPAASSARVGAHRGPKPRGRGWIVFAWAALATALLVGAGVTYLAVVNNSIQFDGVFGGSTSAATSTETPTPTPTVVPAVDPAATVTVLNGTDIAGLATAVGDVVIGNGWAQPTVANASETDVATSTVYYSDAANEAAALAMSQQLGIPLELSSAFPGATITVVIGADYTGPGSEGLVPAGDTTGDGSDTTG